MCLHICCGKSHVLGGYQGVLEPLAVPIQMRGWQWLANHQLKLSVVHLAEETPQISLE